MAKDIFDRNYFSPVKDKEIGDIAEKKSKKKDEDNDSDDFILNNFVEDKDQKLVKNKKRLKSNFKLKKEEKKDKKKYFKVFKNSRLVFILMIFLLAIFNSSMIYNDFKNESNLLVNSVNLSSDGKYFFGMVEVTNSSINTKSSYFDFVKYYFSNKPIIQIGYNDLGAFEKFLTKYFYVNYIGFVIINFLVYLLLFKAIEWLLTGIFDLYSIIASKREFKNFSLINIVVKRSMFILFVTLFGLLLIPDSYLGYLFYILFVIIHSLVVIERKVLK